MTYIYLNTYDNGLMYVGSHTWNGEGIDPNYNGSSRIAAKFGWVPVKIEILESAVDSRQLREREWIERYCKKYGLSDYVHIYNHLPDWVSKFPQHGLMLNCHSNDASHLQTKENHDKSHESSVRNGSFQQFLDKSHSPESQRLSAKAAHTSEAQAKRKATKIANGSYQRFYEASHSSEAIKKALETRVNNGSMERFIQAGQIASKTPEALKKMVESHNYKESIAKTVKNRSKRVKWTIVLTEDGRVVATGRFKQCFRAIGHDNWSCRAGQIAKAGQTRYNIHGYDVFVVEDGDTVDNVIFENGLLT